MRWWDGGARVRAALAAVNALALGGVAEGWLRTAAWAGAACGAALLARSLRRLVPPAEKPLGRLPERKGSIYLGRGFEWTREEAQETADTGIPARREDADLWLPDRLLERHALVLGTTGTGKTRLLELLALQAIARGDAAVVIDPKGDERLLSRIRAAAGPRFRLLSLPHPERSVRYNPIGRYRDVREVADRVAALLPSGGDALPFRNFGWEIVHAAARELHGRKPMTLRNLKRAAIDQPAGALRDRPREHHLKMASALVPVLTKLSSDLLSPEEGGISWEEADRERQVVYLSLGSLLGQESASAVAKMATLDLAAYVGARYAFSKGRGPVWLLVDELGDVVTCDFISVLNKSRGAGLRVVACAQTVSDLEAALGGRAQALRALGNANTVIQFRTPAAADAEAFSGTAGTRLLRTRSEGAAYEPALLGSGFRTVDDFRARFSESADWREQPLVPPWAVVDLPVFHFFASLEGRVVRGRVPLLR
jgi:conjugal transfer pilus assembly protein TraD